MRYAVLMLAAVLGFGAGSDYRLQVEKWRQSYEQKLQKTDGWLSVAGLFWLHEGVNRVGSDPQSDVVLPKDLPWSVGTLKLADKTAIFHDASGDHALVADKDPVWIGRVSIVLIERNQKIAVRMRDPNADTRTHFAGSKWFPIKEEYRVEAKWIPYDPPRTIRIASILGYSSDEPSPGYAEFQLHGDTFRLEPIVEEPGELFFIFKDQTAGHETYGAGRFLDTATAIDGLVVLDFNESYNPPCAFTAFATCPLPPRQNVLATRIEAGELKYGNH